MGSPLSDGIKVFESEAWWIDALVALKAGGVVSVFDGLVNDGAIEGFDVTAGGVGEEAGGEVAAEEGFFL